MSQTVKASHVALFISIALTIGILLGVWLAPSSKDDNETLGEVSHVNKTNKMTEIMRLIPKRYVDSISYEQVEECAIQLLLQYLDPHSVYVPKLNFVTEKENLEGEMEGVGLWVSMVKDTAFIIEVFKDSPSDRAGILGGDRIVTINGESVFGRKFTNKDVVKRLKGPKGTMVNLGISRRGESKVLNFKLKRTAIPLNTVRYSGMLDDEIGYISLTEFSATTYKEMRVALSKLRSQGMQKLILDLRGNGGGLLYQAREVADLFLSQGQLIVYTEGVNSPKEEYYSTTDDAFVDGSFVVMMNEYSASASEVVAGAIQDNDRGLIVGRRSFGKGLVQKQFEMFDGSALRLTTARYYTPSGRCIQRPYDKGSDEYYLDFLLRILADMESDSIIQKVTDTTKYYTKEGRVVYAGGGIFPDEVLPYEKDVLLIYYNRLEDKDIFYNYAFDYVDKNRALLLKKYPQSDDYVKGFSLSDEMFEDFLMLAEKSGIKRNVESIAAYGNEMKILVKAYMAEFLYGKELYYGITLSADHELQKAINIIKKK
ncbi:MAG: S41 family peptidase [Bacteroidales bacterium]|nr:S41 family peptidase [Bacteroidales bacterium]